MAGMNPNKWLRKHLLVLFVLFVRHSSGRLAWNNAGAALKSRSSYTHPQGKDNSSCTSVCNHPLYVIPRGGSWRTISNSRSPWCRKISNCFWVPTPQKDGTRYSDTKLSKGNNNTTIYFKDGNQSVEKKSPSNQSMLGSAKQLNNSSWQRHWEEVVETQTSNQQSNEKVQAVLCIQNSRTKGSRVSPISLATDSGSFSYISLHGFGVPLSLATAMTAPS